MENKKKIYIDGVFDLFHRGHLESLRKAKNYSENSYLIVGIVSDEDAEGYKRKPIISFEDRCEIIKAINIVDEVIEKSPLVVTKEFIEEHGIDYVVHGFANQSDWDKQKSFFEPIIDKFGTIEYYDKISTTDIISKIKNNY
jgi:choline-phosphate cytidylyltransferase